LGIVIGLARNLGALGVNLAHSGTVIGVLLDPSQADGPAMAAYLAAHLLGLESISLNQIVGGGPRLAGMKGAFCTSSQTSKGYETSEVFCIFLELFLILWYTVKTNGSR
jgi:hypothetical protein